MKVYLAISQVAARLAKEGIAKDRKNDQQNYKFRGIDDVYNALAPFLAEAKLCILPHVLSREVVERTTAKGNAIFYVTVQVRFDFVSAEDASKHEVVTYGEAMDSADKATNKAMSAAYKYAAMQAFCIPTEGDNDADATTHEVRAVIPQNVTPNAGAGDDLTAAQKEKVSRYASAILDWFEAGNSTKAFEAYGDCTEDMDVEEKRFLWTFLSSSQRSAIKKAGEAKRKPALAEQA